MEKQIFIWRGVRDARARQSDQLIRTNKAKLLLLTGTGVQLPLRQPYSHLCELAPRLQ